MHGFFLHNTSIRRSRHGPPQKVLVVPQDIEERIQGCRVGDAPAEEGPLKSGSGKKVTSKKQAIAIGLSEARKKGKKVARKKS